MRFYERVNTVFRPPWIRATVVLVFVFLYALSFGALHRRFGLEVLALPVLPVAAAGMFFGLTVGIVAGILSLPLDVLVLYAHGLDGWAIMRGAGPGIAVTIAVGGLTGWLHDLHLRVRAQSAQLREKQAALAKQIAERERAKRELRKSEARFRRLAENAPDIIYRYRLRPTLRCEYVNPIVTDVVGYTPEEHYVDPELGFKIVHPEDRPKLEQLRDAPDEDEVAMTLRWIRKDGAVIWTDHRIMQVLDARGRTVAVEGIARDITDLKAAEEKQARYADRLETLHALDQAILAAKSDRAIARAAVQYAGQLLPGHSVNVLVFDFETEEARLLAQYADGSTSSEHDVRFSLDSGHFRTVVEQLRRNRIHVLDVSFASAEPTLEHYVPQMERVRTLLYVPLLTHETLIGSLVVGTERTEVPTDEIVEITRELADSLAIGMQQSRLFAAERSRRRAAAALLEITQVAGSSLEQTEVLKRISQRTAQACESNRCSILLLDETGDYLEPVMSQFADGHAEPQLWQQFKTTAGDRVDVVPLFRTAIRERQPALLTDTSRTDLIPRKWTEPFGIRQLLVVPLISKDAVIGIMLLDHVNTEREFTDEQIELARTIGGQVAVSIENAQLYAKMQELAITDSVTGCYNRRGFFEMARREIERARRFGRPLAVMMIDVDHFKTVNDACGHSAGDRVLTALATGLKRELREIDVIGRYGGDEFAVLLPETTLDQASMVAERLHRVAIQLTGTMDHDVRQITLSIGIAAMHADHDDVETLLQRADQALYAAKRGGRNQTRIWNDDRMELA